MITETKTDNTIEVLRRLSWRRDEIEAQLIKVIREVDSIAENMMDYWNNLNAGSER